MPSYESQRKITEYYTKLPVLFLPYKGNWENRRGLSEKVIRRRMERQRWIVWRGGIIGVQKELEIYPNVKRKYQLLAELMEEHKPGLLETLEYLAKVHHGMPDFLCFRKGEWKFIECKLGHEQLSNRQKHCIRKLQELGFHVEVHKLAEDCTKTRRMELNLDTGEKIMLEKQMKIKKKY